MSAGSEKTRFIERGLEYLGPRVSSSRTVLDVLADTSIFNLFTPVELRALAGFFHAYNAREGALIFKENEHGQYMCLLVDGRAGVYKEGDKGERKKLSTVRPGKTMGEMAVIDGLPTSATVIAEVPSVLVLITRENLEQLMQKQPHVAAKLVWQLAKLISLRLRQATGALVDFLS